jgi:porphobilinogen synthase
MVAETRIHPASLVLPVFVQEGIDTPVDIVSMPGVQRHSLDSLAKVASDAVSAGLGGIMLFGVPTEEHKDPSGSYGVDENGILNQALRRVRSEVGDEIVIMADTCLDEFTTHGHCGVLDSEGRVDNDKTVQIYTNMAVAQAQAGAHMVCPSGMMDDQVESIRFALELDFHDVGILAYSAKYASAFYGPFRDAVACSLTGDRRTYQMDPANRREGSYEAEIDISQDADMVMVKPAGYYLDVLSDVARLSPVPVAAYQVSGEYSMIQAAGQRGWIDAENALRESVLCILRAGADVVLTYGAMELAGEK